MAEHYLEPTHHDEHFLYFPNRALVQIMTSARMDAVVTDYTAKVAATYLQRIAPRSNSGGLAEGVSASTFIGGHRKDRVVGEVVSGAVYAAADELGRHEFNPYEGSHDLRDSLYSILPTRI